MSMSARWVWCDLEMTGLDPYVSRIIEIASIITDSDLNIIAEGPSIVIHQPEIALQDLSPWIYDHHGQSGLLDAVRKSNVTLAQAQSRTLDFIKDYVEPGKSPLCGNSIGTDRAFLQRHMPDLSAYLHYRNIDVTSIKLVLDKWCPHHAELRKKGAHRALDDIKESIDQLRVYRNFILSKPTE